MALEEFTGKSFDGLSILYRRWTPSGSIKGVVNHVHGLGEHSGRYMHVAEAFNKAGYVFNSMDLRGHGKSEGARGFSPSFDALVTDIEYLVKMGRAAFPEQKQFLYGHSLGGTLVLYYRLTSKHTVDAVIATSPGLKPGYPISPAKLTLARTMSELNPKYTLANGLARSMLSRDGRVVRAYNDDPLVHDRITARMGWDLLQKGEWIINQREKLKGPILLVVGSRDKIVDYQTVVATQSGLDDRITLKVWEGLYHETHNEPEKNEVIQYNIDWINAHMN